MKTKLSERDYKDTADFIVNVYRKRLEGLGEKQNITEKS
jgi:hypothetical protein